MFAENHMLQMHAQRRLALYGLIALLIALLGIGLATHSALASASGDGEPEVPGAPAPLQASSLLAPEAGTTCSQEGALGDIAPLGGTITVFMTGGGVPSDGSGLKTPVRKITLLTGGVVHGYCMNGQLPSTTGAAHCLATDLTDVRLAYLLTKYPATVASNTDQAARQAAVWHFTNGWILVLSNPTSQGATTDTAVANAYTAIVNEVQAVNPNNPPPVFASGPVSLTITPASATNGLPGEPSHTFTVKLTKGDKPLAGYPVTVAATFGTLNQVTGATDATGVATFTISSAVAGTANITANASVTIPGRSRYLNKSAPQGNQPIGFFSAITVDVTATATKTWIAAPGNGKITLTKSVVDASAPWAFTFTLDDANQRIATDGEPTVLWDNLTPNQTYTLAEVDPGATWQVGAFNCTVNGTAIADADPATGGFQVPIAPDANVLCTIANAKLLPPTGAIRLTKNVVGGTAPWSFSFTLDGANQRFATDLSPLVVWDNLAPNQSYTLAEEDPGAPWQLGQIACSIDGVTVADAGPDAGFQINVTPDATVLCSVTNTVPPDDTEYNVGDDDSDGNLDVTEEWLFTCRKTITKDTVNRAKARGTSSSGQKVSAAASATVKVITPKLTIAKTASKLVVYRGSLVTYTVTVRNRGNVALTNVLVADGMDACTLTPVAQGNGDNVLDRYEKWVAICGVALDEDTTNTAMVTAIDPKGTMMTATASVAVNVVQPAIQIEKEVDKPIVYGGERLKFTLRVTNIGDEPLYYVTVKDSLPQCKLSARSGDVGNDGQLGVGEQWVYTCSLTACQDTSSVSSVDGEVGVACNPAPDLCEDVTNVGTVTAKDRWGKVWKDSDSVFVDVVRPQITVSKRVDRSVIVAGQTVTFTVGVKNTGDGVLTGISVVDSLRTSTGVNAAGDEGVLTVETDYPAPPPVCNLSGPIGDDDNGVLDMGEQWLYTCATVLTRNAVNTATATGHDARDRELSDNASVSVIVGSSGPCHIQASGATVGSCYAEVADEAPAEDSAPDADEGAYQMYLPFTQRP